MRDISSGSWHGLPIYECEYRRGNDGVRLPMSLLFFWRADGMSLEVSSDSGRRAAYSARAGRFDLLPAGSFIEVTRAEHVVHPIIVALPSSWLSSLCGQPEPAFPPEQPRLQFSDRTLERLLACLLHQHALREPLGTHYTQSLSLILAQRLLAPDGDGRQPWATPQVLPDIVRRHVVELIDENLDAPPDVHSLAGLAGLGTLAFLRAFKATLGYTLHQYVLHRRIERAKLLLASPSPALTTVALELGFASHAHFTTAFRVHTGCTPSEFRQAQGFQRVARM